MSKWKQNSPPGVPQQISRESFHGGHNRAAIRLAAGPGTYRQTVNTRQGITPSRQRRLFSIPPLGYVTGAFLSLLR